MVVLKGNLNDKYTFIFKRLMTFRNSYFNSKLLAGLGTLTLKGAHL